MSVNRNVTVPDGARSATGPSSHNHDETKPSNQMRDDGELGPRYVAEEPQRKRVVRRRFRGHDRLASASSRSAEVGCQQPGGNRALLWSAWHGAYLLEKSEQISNLPPFCDASVLEAIDAHELSREFRIGGRDAVELSDVSSGQPPATGNAIIALDDIVHVDAAVEGAVNDAPPRAESLEPRRE